MMNLSWEQFELEFKVPAKTSRGVMTHKQGYALYLHDESRLAAGECSFIAGLSPDDLSTYEAHLLRALECLATSPIDENSVEQLLAHVVDKADLHRFPSIVFGLETLLLDYANGMKQRLFENDFSRGEYGLRINGLVWMNTADHMLRQARGLIDIGHKVIKLKVGALDFDEECRMIAQLRKEYPAIRIRLDANGAFTEQVVWQKLEALAKYNIESIEQPIKPGQLKLMRKLCDEALIPIALDEELIGVTEKQKLLEELRPAYIVLKPSLLGGFQACDEWIWHANKVGCGWWATSALESSIGLNAIAQWAASKSTGSDHGLGTGLLYVQNFPSPVYVAGGRLFHSGRPIDFVIERITPHDN